MWPVIVLAFGSLCAALMQTLVMPIQREFPDLLHTTPSTASWVVTATLLAAGVAMPVVGRLADIYGKKPVLVGSAFGLIIGSVVCALAASATPMILGRVLQGFAMGYVPVAISAVRELAPADKRNSAVAAVSATLGVGAAIGLPLSAWIVETTTWHTLFWVSAGLALVVGALTLVAVPHRKDSHPAHLDVVGAIGLAIGLVGVLVGVSKANDWGWGDAMTWSMIGGGLVVLALWSRYEMRHRDPLVDLRTFARRPVLVTNIAAVLIGFGMMAQSIVVPQLLEMPKASGYGLGQTILQAGMWMAPSGLMMLLFTPLSARLLNKLGARVTLSIGAAVLACGYVVGVFLTSAPWQLMVMTCVASAGVGIGYAALPTLILTNVPAEESSSSVGVNTLMRSIGTTTAGAIMALVLTSQTMHLGGAALPTAGAFRWCFVIGAIAAAAGALVVLLVPKQSTDEQEQERARQLAAAH